MDVMTDEDTIDQAYEWDDRRQGKHHELCTWPDFSCECFRYTATVEVGATGREEEGHAKSAPDS